jgi:serine/threonine protein kinase
MGAVFKARDTQAPEHPWVAIKVAQLKGSAVSRFLLEEAFRREGQAAGLLSQHGKYFVGFRASDFSVPAHLVLEFIEWPTLYELKEQVGTLPPLDVALLGVEIVRGVRCMEHRRMVHRDLKPENIFASRTEAGFAIR